MNRKRQANWEKICVNHIYAKKGLCVEYIRTLNNNTKKNTIRK